MESEAPAVPGYVNRPAAHGAERRQVVPVGSEQTGRRTRMRIALVALRAYEQRSERRARMRAWMITRAAAG